MSTPNFEKNPILLLILAVLAIAVGTIITMVLPFAWVNTEADRIETVTPYTALEQAGRDVYIREGCYLCHSQMIRPFRDEKERYGHYSLASESMYGHPFQWGSKRTGPDLARVGGKYSDEWHIQHLIAPRDVVPESVMPNYPWLATSMVDSDYIGIAMERLRMVGVPYTDADIAGAAKEVEGKS